jgi:hypothetical protein
LTLHCDTYKEYDYQPSIAAHLLAYEIIFLNMQRLLESDGPLSGVHNKNTRRISSVFRKKGDLFFNMIFFLIVNFFCILLLFVPENDI